MNFAAIDPSNIRQVEYNKDSIYYKLNYVNQCSA